MSFEQIRPKKNKLERLFLVLPALYILDLFLGFDVHIITIPGVPGANLLLALVSMYAYAIYVIIKSGEKSPKKIITTYFGRLELFTAIFIVFNLLWATLVPLVMGSSLPLGVEEGKVFLALAMVFPAILLIRMGHINWDGVLRFVLAAVWILAALHILLYVGEILAQAGDYAGFDGDYAGQGGFAALFFDYFSYLRLGTSGTPAIIMGNGFVRVIYPTSILLILGVYLLLRGADRLSVRSICLTLAVTVALCTTMTKSLWVGIIGGIAVFVLYMFIFVRKYRGNIIVLLLVAAVTVSVSDRFLFDSMVETRMGNIFSSDSDDIDDPTVPSEASGTVEANQIRIEQVKSLLGQWRKSPVIGHGYGYYVADNVRSDSQPYSYEMFLPALLMKIGVAGVLMWAAFAIYILAHIIKRRKLRPAQSGALIFLAICFVLSIQYNPFLLNLNGMTILSLLLIDAGATDSLPKTEYVPKPDRS